MPSMKTLSDGDATYDVVDPNAFHPGTDVDLDMQGGISNLATPTEDGDAATKDYVDSQTRVVYSYNALPNLNDWNNLPDYWGGCHWCSIDSVGTPSNAPYTPSSGSFWYNVFSMRINNNANYATQFAIATSTGNAYIRYKTGGRWGGWKQIAFE